MSSTSSSSTRVRWIQRRGVVKSIAATLGIDKSAILSVAQGTDIDIEGNDQWLIATHWGLAQVSDAAMAWQRPWTDSVSAKSVPQHGVIEVKWIDGLESALRITDSSRTRRRGLALIIKEQIQQSIVISENWQVPKEVSPGRGSVLIAIRKDQHGELFSQVLGPAMLDLEDPRVSTQIANIEARLRTMCGLPA